MKKKLLNCLKASCMCLAMALSFVIALGCSANIVMHFSGTASSRIHMDLLDAMCYFTVALSNIIVTIAYLRCRE